MRELETRKRIYEEIVMNPGLHFRELQRRLGMQVGMLEYHLEVLKKNGLVVSKESGKYVRYYPNTHMTREERKIIGLLRNEKIRNILIFILERGEVNHGELSQGLGMKSSTLSYYLNILVKEGVVEKDSRGRERYYRVAKEDEVASTIIRYRKSFLDYVVDNFVKMWEKKGKK